MQIVEIRAIVSGEVHGVGFRATTRHLAQHLGISGTVKNVPDGTVEIYAQGSKEQLDHFIQQLRQQFGPSYIKNINIEELKPVKIFNEFRIIH